MRKKLLMCLGVIIVVLIIVLAVIVCVNLNKNGEQIIEENKENVVEEVKENVQIYQESQKDDEPAVIELLTSNAKKVEYNKKLADKSVHIMIDAKTSMTDYNGNITTFNSGKFNDTEKFRLLFTKFNLQDNVNIYQNGSETWVSSQIVQKASKELFGEEINIINLKNVTIKDGKIQYFLPTGFGIQIYKVKSVIHNRRENTYNVKFDMLRYNPDYIPYDALKYNQDDIVATFELKVLNSKTGYIIQELNKI